MHLYEWQYDILTSHTLHQEVTEQLCILKTLYRVWNKDMLQFFMIIFFCRSSSSSSGDNLTDDSGIHSKSTCKDSPQLVTKQEKPMKIERVSLGKKKLDIGYKNH